MEKISYLLKNYSLQNKSNRTLTKHGKLLLQLIMFLFWKQSDAQQIGNYIANGSFEETYTCMVSQNYGLTNAKGWSGIDSLCTSALYLSTCNSKVPKFGEDYQYPRTGNAYILSTFFYPINSSAQIGYQKNRLKSNLKAGHTYCVSFYVNICNASTYGMDSFGAYFGDDNIDTINYCNIPLTYLTPQVRSPEGNVITDTLNWVPVTGTFTAIGTEKFLLLGNFSANNSVTIDTVNPTHLPIADTDAGIDDVSCIEVNLPAYAGRDTTIFLGDSTYIGRESDFAINPGCMWYQLPNNTTAIDTVSGMWVKPNAIGNYTYVVRQVLDCSALKWDTVVVTVRLDDVGIKENSKLSDIKIFPNPTNDYIVLKSDNTTAIDRITISDLMGQQLDELRNVKTNQTIDISTLPKGIYFLKANSKQSQAIFKVVKE